MRTRVLLGQKHLGRYKLPENIYAEKEEGYDGHIKWENTSDLQARLAAFRHAVHNKDEETVTSTMESLGAAATEAQLNHITSLLLSGQVEPLKEALLSAICIGSRPLTEFILSLFHEFPHEETSGCDDSDAFPPHLTPLVLASINNNFALVECFLLRGHYIDPPHHKNCKCDGCLRQPYAALASVEKVDILRALSSDAYLWLATDDPFAAACALSSDLERFIQEDNLEYTDWYKRLHEAVQHFVTRMVNQTWTEQELNLFLSHKDYCDMSACEVPFSRVQMALDCGMRDFIASTNVQRAMNEVWWSGWGDFGVNTKRDVWRLFRHVPCYLLLAILYIVYPTCKLAKSFNVPLARYISNFTAYFLFLSGLTYVHMHKSGNDTLGIILEWYTYSFIAGMFFERYLMFSRQGFRIHFQFWWRWFDFLLVGVFMLAFHIYVIRLMVAYDREFPFGQRPHVEDYNYVLFYDIYLGIGCMLAYWRIFYFLQLLKGIGPSIISLGRCVGHVYNYLVIMAVIVSSFAVGLSIIHQPYSDSREKFGRDEDMGDLFRTSISGLRQLFWSLFGYLSYHANPIVVGMAGPEYEPQARYLTSALTEFLVAVYHMIVIITVLNLMVSILVKKAEEVLENEELEFKFTRVVIFSEFIHWSSAVPPPLNIILATKHIIECLFDGSYLFRWPEIFIQKHLVDVNPMEAERKHVEYQILLKKTFFRYRASKEYHYKSVWRADGNIKEKPIFAAPKVAFMQNTMNRY